MAKAEEKCYENYPYIFIILANALQISIYAIGAFIISLVGFIWLILYLILIIWLEIRLLKRSCVNCYYYGKRCAFGKGKTCSLLFRKGNPKKFLNDKITWKDILPDFMVSIIPAILGIVLLIINFNWILLVLVILLFLLTSFGNGLVRGSLACKYCKQRKIGCPAANLFDKKK